ncbi:MAG: LiaF transmembrane domain-containing protein [Vicinamibacterales bacterium]
MKRPQCATRAGFAWGGVVIVFGLLLLAERLEFLNFEFSGQFWPFILIAFGVARLAESPDTGAGRPRRSGGWLLYVGLWALATELNVAGLDYDTSWPLLVIGVGGTIVWRALHGNPACRRLSSRGPHAA